MPFVTTQPFDDEAIDLNDKHKDEPKWIRDKILQCVEDYKNYPSIIVHILYQDIKITKTISHVISDYVGSINELFLEGLDGLIRWKEFVRCLQNDYKVIIEIITFFVRYYNMFTQTVRLPCIESDESKVIFESCDYNQNLDDEYDLTILNHKLRINQTKYFLNEYILCSEKINDIFESYDTDLLILDTPGFRSLDDYHFPIYFHSPHPSNDHFLQSQKKSKKYQKLYLKHLHKQSLLKQKYTKNELNKMSKLNRKNKRNIVQKYNYQKRSYVPPRHHR